jgi:hypothetical protein
MTTHTKNRLQCGKMPENWRKYPNHETQMAENPKFIPKNNLASPMRWILQNEWEKSEISSSKIALFVDDHPSRNKTKFSIY